MEFREITIKDKDIIQRYLNLDSAFMAERNFAGLFLWCDHYKVKMCIEDDCLYLCSEQSDDSFIIFPPFTKNDFKHATIKLLNYAKTKSLPILINSISAPQREKLTLCFGLDAFEFEENRAAMDYIYKAEDMMWLSGKKFSAKRNHINKFLSLYDNRWIYEDMDAGKHFDEIINFQIEWAKRRGDATGENTPETLSIKKALTYFDDLDLRGGILRVDGTMIAFTIGKKVSNLLFGVMYEKADISFEGSYAMINQQFAQHNFEGVSFVNREEDLGLEGLRKAKLSYNPIELTVKYSAKVNLDKIL